jgi:hypothetical protein
LQLEADGDRRRGKLTLNTPENRGERGPQPSGVARHFGRPYDLDLGHRREVRTGDGVVDDVLKDDGEIHGLLR